MSSATKSLEHLFISKVRIKTLSFFLLNPSETIHLRGAVREFKEEINAVRRELVRLEELQFINCENKGNRKYFSLNKDHPFVPELTSLFHKSFGLGAEIINNKSKLGNIEIALLTPYYVSEFKYSSNPIDMLIIGKVDLSILEKLVSKTESIKKREIHYTVLTQNEFSTRKRRGDKFITDVLLQENVVLIGTTNEATE